MTGKKGIAILAVVICEGFGESSEGEEKMALIKETLAAYSVWQWLLFFFLYNFAGWVY